MWFSKHLLSALAARQTLLQRRGVPKIHVFEKMDTLKEAKLCIVDTIGKETPTEHWHDFRIEKSQVARKCDSPFCKESAHTHHLLHKLFGVYVNAFR